MRIKYCLFYTSNTLLSPRSRRGGSTKKCVAVIVIGERVCGGGYSEYGDDSDREHSTSRRV